MTQICVLLINNNTGGGGGYGATASIISIIMMETSIHKLQYYNSDTGEEKEVVEASEGRIWYYTISSFGEDCIYY
jgi:hypothetical protein